MEVASKCAMPPRKRLPLHPEKKDLLSDCNTPDVGISDHEVFMGMFCRRCRNPGCVRAQHGNPWIYRMAHQVDNLLENPHFSALDSEEHRKIAASMFEDRLLHAAKQEVARKAQDWTIPQLEEIRSEATRPAEITVEAREKPRGFVETEEDPDPMPTPDPPPESTKPVVAPPPPPQSYRPPHKKVAPPINTPVPAEGMMVDGSPPPTKSAQPQPEEEDPWSIPDKVTIVPPGAKIVLR